MKSCLAVALLAVIFGTAVAQSTSYASSSYVGYRYCDDVYGPSYYDYYCPNNNIYCTRDYYSLYDSCLCRCYGNRDVGHRRGGFGRGFGLIGGRNLGQRGVFQRRFNNGGLY